MTFEIGETKSISNVKRKAFEILIRDISKEEGIKETFDRFSAFEDKVNRHIKDGFTFGDALGKVCREESPIDREDEGILEVFSVWLVFKSIMVLMPQQMPLANITLAWNVKYEWIREVYRRGLEVSIRAVIGSQRYWQTKKEQREHLKSLFSEVLAEHMTVKEFKAQAQSITVGPKF